VEWLMLGLGIPAGVFATLMYDVLKGMVKARRQTLALEGTWAEFVKDSKGHQYTLGRIYFDKRRGFWAFDGTNFTNEGEPFCHFETVSSHVDVANRQFFYTFTARIENELDKTYYGFGVVNLAANERGELTPVHGHYVSANVDGKGMSHSMIPVDLKYSRRVAGSTVLDLVDEATPRRRLSAPARKSKT
jgi:hypothetical protein